MSHLPDKGVWTKCPACGAHVNQLEWGSIKKCPQCGSYQRLTIKERLTITIDDGSFEPISMPPNSDNWLKVAGYSEKLAEARKKTEITEAIAVGTGSIDNKQCAIGIMDSHFMMGTLNTTVGDRIKQLYLFAAEKRIPLILMIASGGARMQEGIFSLLQMNTILAAKQQYDRCHQVSISVLTDPTMGGVSASFAFKNDIVVAEDQAQIGFAGPRVIQATSQEQLPRDFQQASQLFAHGLIDDRIRREDLRDYLSQLLTLHQR